MLKTGIIELDKKNNVTLSYYIQEPLEELSNALKKPAMLVLPGGGYYMCSDREAEPVALAYAGKGYQVFILRYSLGKENNFQKSLEDAENALQMIYDKCEEWFVDKNKVGVIGFSAGGHLASGLGTSKKIRPKAVLLGYPCILKSIGDVLAFEVPSTNELVDENTPSTFIFGTSEDSLVPVEHSLAFANSLAMKKIPFELHIFKNGCHGLSLGTAFSSNSFKELVDRDFSQWFELSVKWLNNIWGDFETNRSVKELQ